MGRDGGMTPWSRYRDSVSERDATGAEESRDRGLNRAHKVFGADQGLGRDLVPVVEAKRAPAPPSPPTPPPQITQSSVLNYGTSVGRGDGTARLGRDRGWEETGDPRSEVGQRPGLGRDRGWEGTWCSDATTCVPSESCPQSDPSASASTHLAKGHRVEYRSEVPPCPFLGASAFEWTWHIQDNQGQILALNFI